MDARAIDDAIASREAERLEAAFLRLLTWPYESPITGSSPESRANQLRAVAQALMLDDRPAPDEIHDGLLPASTTGALDDMTYGEAADFALGSFDSLMSFIESEGGAAFPN